jgi:hypothetical protein
VPLPGLTADRASGPHLAVQVALRNAPKQVPKPGAPWRDWYRDQPSPRDGHIDDGAFADADILCEGLRDSQGKAIAPLLNRNAHADGSSSVVSTKKIPATLDEYNESSGLLFIERGVLSVA